jgi:enolase
MINLDGTENKSRLGANAILGVSMAVARAAAISEKQELYEYIAKTYSFGKKYTLPTPSFNIFNGGKHADTNLDFQEFMILPMQNWQFKDKLRAGSEIFHALGDVLRAAGLDTDVGNEGGYAPDIESSIQAIEMIVAAMIRAGYKPGEEIGLGIDVGSSGLYDESKKKYIFKLDKANYTAKSLVQLYHEWWRKYPIISIEDGLAEDDWEGWREMTKELGSEMLLIGDDLFVTNEKRLRMGLKEKVANAVLVKLNQVGSLTETINTIKLAQKHNYKLMISHRSGETCDDFIADLAVAVGAEYIKSGSTSRSERLAKYNRLLEIEMILKKEY